MEGIFFFATASRLALRLTCLHLVLGLRVYGAILSLSQYIIMAWCSVQQYVHLRGVIFSYVQRQLYL